jgi:hypothetical protein
MSNNEPLDELLAGWTYDPQSVNVRLVTGTDDRDVLQMRVDMGILQLETSGRPDGTRPFGFQTYYDYLLGEELEDRQFELSEEQCAEVDREFVQFYHRRICWLTLREFERAVEDADHTLALMDFCVEHSPSDEWTIGHEQYRPFVLFHRTQAAALAELEGDSPETAVHQINVGLERLQGVFTQHESEELFEDDELVVRLTELRESLRDHYQVGRTLYEQLRDAVDAEQYELAARIRDELQRRETGYSAR